MTAAHIIRQGNTILARAIFALESSRRWAVTGTPIQNRLTDVASLFRFLRVYPFDDPETFRQHVSRNWKNRADPQAIAKLRLLINSITIRRPKKAINLPCRTDEVHTLDFGTEERRHYDAVKAKTVGEIDAVLHTWGARSCLSALQSISTLRLICNHGITESGQPSSENGFQPVWNIDSAQQVFESLRDAAQAYCIQCNQDLSYMVSDGFDCGDNILLQPRVSQGFQLFCASCFELRPCAPDVFLPFCNHFPKCSSNFSSGATTPIAPLEFYEDSISRSRKPSSTKISALVGSLIEHSTEEKRRASPILVHRPMTNFILLVLSSRTGPRPWI